jgi:hypothetical protein
VRHGRRCQQVGCRAWAVRGEVLCYAHLTQRKNGARQRMRIDEDEPAHMRPALERRIDEVVARFAAASGLERESLSEEIGALRIVLARLLVEEDDPSRLATSIPRVVDAVVRAVRAQRAISGAMAEGLTDAVTQVLIELGLGGES